MSYYTLMHMKTTPSPFWPQLAIILMLPVVQHVHAQNLSGLIVVDQFGYRPAAVKTAVIKNPQKGADKDQSITPGSTYRVIDSATGQSVHQGAPVSFNNGQVDEPSGDIIWWFDFSQVTAPGTYYVLDAERNLRSYSFSIREDVYNEALKHAVRMLFYQRAGCEKDVKYAGEGWADNASHIGLLQDKNCRLYNKKDDASTERDLHGGWYDAGDYNKYTAWAANYVEALLLAYQENPEVFSDDYNIPESGNGIPDILDEVKWGMDWLLRMQNNDGSLLSIVALDHAFPPSAATGQSLYGPANTIATVTSVKAFALGAMVYKEIGMDDYASQLETAALKAWQWAEANPSVFFYNSNISGLGAGEQESNDTHARLENRCLAGLYMYELTGEASYLTIFENNYRNFPLYEWYYFVGQYWHRQQMMYLKYLAAPYGKAEIQTDIRNYLVQAFNKADNYGGKAGKDGYRSFILDYNWGSNQYKSDYGLFFYLWARDGVEPAKVETYFEAAEEYLHYIHGANPFNRMYLTNMDNYGASNSLTEIYHSWFDHFSSKWDKAGVSTYGPAPGYLAGGANSFYTWDGCCDNNGCGSAGNNAMCLAEPIPVGEPPAKMYKDFNTSWPLNSWSLTEPSIGYQAPYIRLLSKFASTNTTTTGLEKENAPHSHILYPNPVRRGEKLFIQLNEQAGTLQVTVYSTKGETVASQTFRDCNTVNLETAKLSEGIYIVRGYSADKEFFVKKVQVLR